MNLKLDDYKKDYELFHVKYGRGATIVAIAKSKQEELIKAVELYHNKSNEPHPVYGYTNNALEPVIGLEETEDYVTLTLQYSGKIDAVIEQVSINRTLPKSQITFEIFE